MLHSFVIRAITDGNWNFLLFAVFLLLFQVSLVMRAVWAPTEFTLLQKCENIHFHCVVNTLYKTLNGVKSCILCNRRLSGWWAVLLTGFNRLLVQRDVQKSSFIYLTDWLCGLAWNAQEIGSLLVNRKTAENIRLMRFHRNSSQNSSSAEESHSLFPHFQLEGGKDKSFMVDEYSGSFCSAKQKLRNRFEAQLSLFIWKAEPHYSCNVS